MGEVRQSNGAQRSSMPPNLVSVLAFPAFEFNLPIRHQEKVVEVFRENIPSLLHSLPLGWRHGIGFFAHAAFFSRRRG